MRSLRTRWAVLACAAIGLLGAGAATAAEQVSALRVMLHPVCRGAGRVAARCDGHARGARRNRVDADRHDTHRRAGTGARGPRPRSRRGRHGQGAARRSQRAVGRADPDAGACPQGVRGRPVRQQARPAADGPPQGRRHAGLAHAAGAARQPDRDDGHAGTPDRQHFRAERAARPEPGSARATGGGAAGRPERAVCRSRASRVPARRAERPVLRRAVVARESRDRHQRGNRVGTAAGRPQRDRRSHRHRHPAASRPGRPRAAGLRLHLRSRPRARRQRA